MGGSEKDCDSPPSIDEILQRHVLVGRSKPISYLPIRTIEKVLGKTIPEYQTIITEAGNSSRVFTADRCCISSGAVYAFSEPNLDAFLEENATVLSEFGWPRSSQLFVEKIATEWFDEQHPMLPVIRRAFGD